MAFIKKLRKCYNWQKNVLNDILRLVYKIMFQEVGLTTVKNIKNCNTRILNWLPTGIINSSCSAASKHLSHNKMLCLAPQLIHISVSPNNGRRSHPFTSEVTLGSYTIPIQLRPLSHSSDTYLNIIMYGFDYLK